MILVIDNYDSFTYNLVHMMGGLNHEIRVIRNDDMGAKEALALNPTAIILSPGPATPNEAGICLELINLLLETDGPPLLGICLGHQAIGQAMGGKIIRTAPHHGKISQINHTQTGLFKNVNNPLSIVRYHSLIIDQNTLHKDLVIDATIKPDIDNQQDDIIMAIHHKSKPIYGLQFHPESIKSEQGQTLIDNFFQIALK